jgi:hypothetical protein
MIPKKLHKELAYQATVNYMSVSKLIEKISIEYLLNTGIVPLPKLKKLDIKTVQMFRDLLEQQLKNKI